MPMYRVRCLRCNKLFDEYASIDGRHDIKCECGGDTKISFEGIKTFAGQAWTPFTDDNFTGKPIVVKSKSHLKQLCKEHGVYSDRLD